MNKICVAKMGAAITLVYDGEPNQKYPNRGDFLGLCFIPPKGDWEWIAVNGDHGACADEEEAIREIQKA